MTLAERLNSPVPSGSRQGLPCSVATLLSQLPDTEAKALKKMIDAPWAVWGHNEIERALFEEGHRIGRGTVGKHRRGECRCRVKR